MQRKIESATVPPTKIPACDASCEAGIDKEVLPPPLTRQTIDFHSPEYNRVDDLNDFTGNYRSFQTPAGIITAHERYQKEFRNKGGAFSPLSDDRAGPDASEVKTDTGEAPEAPASVTLTSEGRTLIIDTDAERAIACGKILEDNQLSCTIVLTGSTSPGDIASSLSQIRLVHADSVSVTGAFSRFSVKVVTGRGEPSLAEWFDNADFFDLVLDLQPAPSHTGGRMPIGYYAPGPDPAALGEALSELPEMRGQFKKPRFSVFHKDRCFHGRSRTHDCRRCLEICPVNAIQSVNRTISIDHCLCQGCGACALVCPADAFKMIQPSLKELLNSLQKCLGNRSADGMSPMSLVISDSEPDAGYGLSARHESTAHRPICFIVEQISRIRLEVLLAALAYGAREVLVLCTPQNPPAIRDAIARQVLMARAVLEGLSLGEERIRFLSMPGKEIDPTIAVPFAGETMNNVPLEPASMLPSGLDSRTLVYLAAQHLNRTAKVRRPWFPLPKDSPFGVVAVDTSACTLCMACVSACPSGALASGGTSPRLVFREHRCHQCGLCRETCPESVIRMTPRLLLDHGDTETQTVLCETEPFRCVECGVPFATPAMISRMQEKLSGHWMYAGQRELRRLQMCSTCRTRDALTALEAGTWSP